MSLDRQFELTDGDGAYVVCWLKDDPRLTPGTRLTLKETGKRLWRILWRSEYVVDDKKIHRHWRVGGIT